MSDALMEAARLYNDPRFLSKSEIRIYENKKRRQRIVRRQKMAIVFIITVIIVFIMFFRNTMMTSAQEDDFIPQCKYYKIVTVHSQDTLWDIAAYYFDEDKYESFSSYVSEICKINKLSDGNMIKAGENLVVPYYDAYK